ncbi:hemolysin family protein [Brevibacterium album]|uniref:hemolysin family protein n=1 Tax=Brevibacterium album TaxID=417948 RepID=UPI0003F899A3|nr:hemolysin family protein [Brevibacterium album]
MVTVGLFAAALFSVGLAGLLVAAEAALAAVSRSEVAEAAASGRRGAARVERVLADPRVHMYVLTFVRQLFEALATVLIALAYDTVFGTTWEMVVCAVVTAPVALFVVAGVSPRTVARHWPLATSLLLGGLVSGLRTALGPVALVLVWLGNMLTPARATEAQVAPLSESQLLDYVERASASDVIEDEERDMIENVIALGDTRAHKIMVPRTDLVTIAASASLDEAMTLFLRSGFSRVPVVGADDDDVRGILYLKDAARRLHVSPDLAHDAVAAFVRPAVFVPETKEVDELLAQMQADNVHLAVVVDEYGGTAGMVTIEDIVEEIVGEIDDEYDSQAADAVAAEDGSVTVSARMDIEDLAELFGVRIEEEDVSTVGGLLQKLVGRALIEGSAAGIAGLRLTALPGQGRRHRIHRIRVVREAGPEEASERRIFGAPAPPGTAQPAQPSASAQTNGSTP